MEKQFETVECGGAREPGKRVVAIILRREELLYDIRNYCYVEGHIMADGQDEVRHTVQDVGETGNVDRVTRMLDLVHADVVERLYPFTVQELRNPVVDNCLHGRAVYGIVLNVPVEFAQSTLNLLGRLVHELMVCLTVADWMSITNPPKEETWKRKAEGLLERIGQVRSSRKGRLRIRGHWF